MRLLIGYLKAYFSLRHRKVEHLLNQQADNSTLAVYYTRVTEYEVIGAIQNLIHKKMYPIEKILYQGGDYLFTTIKASY
jgi:hypothetical protein